MKQSKQPSSHYTMFRIFGFRVYITRERLRPKVRSNTRKAAYRARMAIAGNKCECCGRELTIYGHLLHTLPKGHEQRNTQDEIRVLCSDCYNRVQSEVSVRCYDTAAPAYVDIVCQAIASASATAQKGGDA